MTGKIEEKVLTWLSEEGMLRQKVTDDKTNFHFVLNYPKNNSMDVIQPKNKHDMIVIGCATQISPEHIERFRKLSSKEKDKFMWEFRFLLNNMDVDFQLKHPNKILEGFVVTTEIYEDGLSKDRLVSSVKKVFRAKLSGVWKIQMKFGIPKRKHDSSSDAMYV